jgi:hypothetical protein
MSIVRSGLLIIKNNNNIAIISTFCFDFDFKYSNCKVDKKQNEEPKNLLFYFLCFFEFLFGLLFEFTDFTKIRWTFGLLKNF